MTQHISWPHCTLCKGTGQPDPTQPGNCVAGVTTPRCGGGGRERPDGWSDEKNEYQNVLDVFGADKFKEIYHCTPEEFAERLKARELAEQRERSFNPGGSTASEPV